MKKTRAFILVATILAISICAFAACGNKNNSNSTFNNLKAEANDLVAFTAATTGAIFDSSMASVGSAMAGEEVAPETTPETTPDTTTPDTPVVPDHPEVNPDTEVISKYLPIVENFIGQKPMNVVSESGEFKVSEEADAVVYKTKVTITNYDINNNSYTYVMYLNESELVNDEDEEEFQSTIDGVMVSTKGGATQNYTITGTKEIEFGEYEISLKASIDEQNYITIEHEAEQEDGEIERGYEYSIYENGKLVDSFELEIEEEQNETEIELTKLVNGEEQTFKFERELNTDDNKEYIKITKIAGGNKEVIKAYVEKDPTTGKESYKVIDQNNVEVEVEKPDFDDDED